MNETYARKLLNQNIQTYEAIASDFSQTRQNIWPELEVLKDYIKPGDKVLDLGCGNGRLYELVSKIKNTKYTGIDASGSLVEIARKRYPDADFKVGNALNLSLEDESYDKIIAVAVLHQIPGRKLRHKFLKEAKRVLKKEGSLLATVWNLWQKKYLPLISNFTIKKLLGQTKLDFKDVFITWQNEQKRYYHAFTKRELGKAAQKAGLKDVKTQYLKRSNRKVNILFTAEK